MLKQVCLTGAVSDLADMCKDLAEIRLISSFRELICYHYDQGTQNWMFFNEHLSKTVDTMIEIPYVAYAYSYDAIFQYVVQIGERRSWLSA